MQRTKQLQSAENVFVAPKAVLAACQQPNNKSNNNKSNTNKPFQAIVLTKDTLRQPHIVEQVEQGGARHEFAINCAHKCRTASEAVEHNLRSLSTQIVDEFAVVYCQRLQCVWHVQHGARTYWAQPAFDRHVMRFC